MSLGSGLCGRGIEVCGTRHSLDVEIAQVLWARGIAWTSEPLQEAWVLECMGSGDVSAVLLDTNAPGNGK